MLKEFKYNTRCKHTPEPQRPLYRDYYFLRHWFVSCSECSKTHIFRNESDARAAFPDAIRDEALDYDYIE